MLKSTLFIGILTQFTTYQRGRDPLWKLPVFDGHDPPADGLDFPFGVNALGPEVDVPW
jgi:hypothetical protein